LKCIRHATAESKSGEDLAHLRAVLTFQAIFALIRRSLGSAVRAVFGWATVALFGVVAASERTLLSLAVGAAGLWPIMLLGAFLPKAAAFVLALLPIPKAVPEEALRVVWIALTVLTPVGVGLVLARHSRIERGRWQRLLMGFPATLGISAAFLVAFVSVPVGKLIAFVKGRREDHVGLVIPPARYREVADALLAALKAGRFELARSEPPRVTRLLAAIMQRFGGALIGAYVPENVEYFSGPDLQAGIYPNGVALSGRQAAVARAHALIAERASATSALQTMSADAQAIERRIQQLWEARGSADVLPGLQSVVRDISCEPLDFDDWQILYREVLQFVVEIRGGAPLLKATISSDRAAAPAAAPAEKRVSRRRTESVRRAARNAARAARRRLAETANRGKNTILQNAAEKLFSLFGRTH
jgi:hypothetical protein